MENLAINLMSLFNHYGPKTRNDISSLYHPEVEFEDPLHRICGREALTEYFDKMYQNVHHCRFDINRQLKDGAEYTIFWKMTLEHPRLKRGKAIAFDGCSHLITDGEKITYHRDYFDVGNMVYEHLPLLGRVIRSLKQRLGKQP